MFFSGCCVCYIAGGCLQGIPCLFFLQLLVTISQIANLTSQICIFDLSLRQKVIKEVIDDSWIRAIALDWEIRTFLLVFKETVGLRRRVSETLFTNLKLIKVN